MAKIIPLNYDDKVYQEIEDLEEIIWKNQISLERPEIIRLIPFGMPYCLSGLIPSLMKKLLLDLFHMGLKNRIFKEK